MSRQALIDSLIQHEGVSVLPYEDTEGHWTIGIGHKLEGIPLSPAAIQMILVDDIAWTEKNLHAVIPYWHEGLTDTRQNVILEMSFNLGATGVKKFKKMWAAIKDENFTAAAFEMMDSKWSNQVGQRAETLARQMREG